MYLQVPSTVTTSDGFTSYCAAEGKSAECCVTSLVSRTLCSLVIVDTNASPQLGSTGLLCSASA